LPRRAIPGGAVKRLHVPGSAVHRISPFAQWIGILELHPAPTAALHRRPPQSLSLWMRETVLKIGKFATNPIRCAEIAREVRAAPGPCRRQLAATGGGLMSIDDEIRRLP
jgi:hypothetical protein